MTSTFRPTGSRTCAARSLTGGRTPSKAGSDRAAPGSPRLKGMLRTLGRLGRGSRDYRPRGCRRQHGFGPQGARGGRSVRPAPWPRRGRQFRGHRFRLGRRARGPEDRLPPARGGGAQLRPRPASPVSLHERGAAHGGVARHCGPRQRPRRGPAFALRSADWLPGSGPRRRTPSWRDMRSARA